MLIGHHGETLDALQYLAGLAANRREIGENGEKSENSAALTVHLAAKGEGIWEVAKSAGCPPDDIMRQNPALTLPLQGGERILIYRSVKEKF